MEQHGKDKGGRPVVFDKVMRDAFLEQLEMGRSNIRACREIGVSRPCLHWTLARDPDFRERYLMAKAASADALLDEAGELAEQALHATSGLAVATIKLRISFLLWQAARVEPRKWGRQAQAVAVIVPAVDADRETAKRLAFLAELKAQVA